MFVTGQSVPRFRDSKGTPQVTRRVRNGARPMGNVKSVIIAVIESACQESSAIIKNTLD